MTTVLWYNNVAGLPLIASQLHHKHLLMMPLNNTTLQPPPPLVFEEWRTIPGYEGYYEASNLGRIRSVPHWVQNSHTNQRPIKEHILHLCPAGGGYLSVGLSKNVYRCFFSVHQLVALAFLGECPEGKEVNHIDGVKVNNWADNLEYVTHSENCKHSFRLGRKHLNGINNSNVKLTEQEVQNIRKDKRRHGLIALDYGISRSYVSTLKLGKTWQYI